MRFLLLFATLALAACQAPATEAPKAPAAGPAAAAAATPATPDPAHIWDLTDLYATVADWHAAREQVLARVTAMEAFQGTLGDSPEALYHALRHRSDTLRLAGRVWVHASLNTTMDRMEALLDARTSSGGSN